MLRLKDLPPEEMNEVVRYASELHDRETQETRERNATVAAAEEVGIPEEYLERAAAEVHARRIAAIHEKRRKQRIGIGAAVAVFVVGGVGMASFHNATPPAAITASVAGATQETNSETEATLSRDGNETILTVNHFGKDSTGGYFANISLAPPKANLSGYRSAKFTLRGTGGLKQVRLDLQNGPTERWRGPVINVPADKTPVSVSLREFTHQQRDSSAAPWKSKGASAIGDITKMGFKTGEAVNDVGAAGSVAVGDIRFE